MHRKIMDDLFWKQAFFEDKDAFLRQLVTKKFATLQR
ncbi:hypothetical protein MGSAQ_000197 [marine sediment metagenome]|uniref:Uncharacterized protein n=1 Tax=marine sediment metagenome TaxID=412755 RepID=A0A1B6NY25_9ZZZZ